MKRLLHALLLATASSSLSPRDASATDINWNSTIGSNNYTSAGSPNLMGGEFVFELGAFAGDFEPDADNTSEWADHWVALDRADYNSDTKFFSSKATLGSNDLPFHWTKKAFIWGFNQETPGEWVLAANPAWSWPFAGGIQPPVTWSIGASGTTAIVGEVNGSGFQMMTAQVAQGAPDVNPDAWQQQHFSAAQRANPSISGWDADPDCDGANNLLELAAGSDPQDPNSRPAPLAELVDTGGGTRALLLTLPRSHRAAINHGAETSADLVSWSGSGMNLVSDTPGELVLSCPGASVSRLFIRLTISL